MVKRRLAEPIKLDGHAFLEVFVVFLSCLVDLDFISQFMQCLFAELLACHVFVTGILCWCLSTADQVEVNDAGDGRLAGRFFAITQDLAEKRPQDNGGAIAPGCREVVVVLVKDFVNLLLGQDAIEGQSTTGKKRLSDLLETASAWT